MAYPLPVFHFSVEWGGQTAAVAEVTGLNWEAQVIEYRDGLSPEFSTIKMSGLMKYSNVTLKKAVFAGDGEFFQWFNQVKMNKPERRDVNISLLNEEHEPVMSWRIVNAWPTKITSPDLKGSGNEVALESVELAHEGITIDVP